MLVLIKVFILPALLEVLTPLMLLEMLVAVALLEVPILLMSLEVLMAPALLKVCRLGCTADDKLQANVS